MVKGVFIGCMLCLPAFSATTKAVVDDEALAIVALWQAMAN